MSARLVTAGSALVFLALVLTLRFLRPRAFDAVEAPSAVLTGRVTASVPLEGNGEF